MDLLLLTVLAFASYAVTMLITKSHAMLWARMAFRDLAWKLPIGIALHFTLIFISQDVYGPVRKDVSDLTDEDPKTGGFDMISCAQCVGFWVSIFLCLCAEVFSPLRILAVYGASFFIHRSERF